MSNFYNPVNFKITTDVGCKGCGNEWGDKNPIQDRCLQCKRCPTCCKRDDVEYSCAYKFRNLYGLVDSHRRSTHLRMSLAAKERYLKTNFKDIIPNMLK